MTRPGSSQSSPFRLSTPESYLLDLLRDGGAHTVEELLDGRRNSAGLLAENDGALGRG